MRGGMGENDGSWTFSEVRFGKNLSDSARMTTNGQGNRSRVLSGRKMTIEPERQNRNGEMK
jgi:hypothetical protein